MHPKHGLANSWCSRNDDSSNLFFFLDFIDEKAQIFVALPDVQRLSGRIFAKKWFRKHDAPQRQFVVALLFFFIIRCFFFVSRLSFFLTRPFYSSSFPNTPAVLDPFVSFG